MGLGRCKMLKLNVGLSNMTQNFSDELEKVRIGLKHNVDYISVISIDTPRIKELWQAISDIYKNWLKDHPDCPTILCSAPIYETILFEENPIDTLKRHLEYGVRAFTFHIAPFSMVDDALMQGFVVNSRGGEFILESKSSPYHDNLDEIIKFAVNNDVKKIFYGTTLRPGKCEPLKGPTIDELRYICGIYDHYKEIYKFDGVDFEIECFGHLPQSEWFYYNHIVDDRPLCAMGPLLNDCVNGYDDINAIIGYSLAKAYGFNIVTECMLSRSEHIKMPTIDDVEDEVTKWKVADFTVNLENRSDYKRKRDKIMTIKESQGTQCSAHINIFGKMNIQETCDVCGEHCPLLREKKGEKQLDSN